MNETCHRRVVLPIVVLLFFLGCGEPQTPEVAPPETPTPTYETLIVALGNSLTEGLGVAEEDAYPALLQHRLNSDGYSVRVVNAGISGETSSGALSRINWIMTLEPDIVILETGANDGLRGIDPKLTAANIEKMLIRFEEKGVAVVLAGMKMGTNLGEPYLRDFEAVYTRAAQRHDLILIPFFLEGVAAVPRLNQPDGIHPTEEGYRKIVDHIYPYVIEALKRNHTKGGLN